MDDPAGSSAWLGSFEGIILPVLAVFWMVILDSVRDDLAGVVQQALEPAHVSVWVSRRN